MSPVQWVVSQLEPCMLVCSSLLLAPGLCCPLQDALLGAPSAASHAWGRPWGKGETLNNLAAAVVSSSFLNSDAVCFVVFWLIFYGSAFAVFGFWKKPAGGRVTGTVAGLSRAELDGGARAGGGLDRFQCPEEVSQLKTQAGSNSSLEKNGNPVVAAEGEANLVKGRSVVFGWLFLFFIFF